MAKLRLATRLVIVAQDQTEANVPAYAGALTPEENESTDRAKTENWD
jgi:hypothetical protein